jgi:hypothetical protein
MPDLNLNTGEYAIVLKAILQSSNYVKPNTELGKQIAEALQILKQVSKGGKPSTSPTGGSSSYCSCFSCKGTKIKSLMHMFGLAKRIGNGR